MIPFDFDYYKPGTAEEAIRIFLEVETEGKKPIYYAGGTEIISFARLNQLQVDAVIDIKAIPECRVLETRSQESMETTNGTPPKNHLVLGAALTIDEIIESHHWPLFNQSAGRIADHTTRCQITLGGNVAGRIPYKEAALPLLLVDADVTIAGPSGRHTVKLSDVFDGDLTLGPAEFIVQFLVDESLLQAPCSAIKKTRIGWIGYPLLASAALVHDGKIRLALTGLRPTPFRSQAMEYELNRSDIALKARIDAAIRQIPYPVISDLHGSADFRLFVLRSVLEDTISQLGVMVG